MHHLSWDVEEEVDSDLRQMMQVAGETGQAGVVDPGNQVLSGNRQNVCHLHLKERTEQHQR